MSCAKLFSGALLTAAVAIWGAGCSNAPPGPGTTNPPPAAEHAHEHVHGPHGGHVIEIGMDEYHAEWTHDEDGKVTVFILDAEMKNDVPIAAETIMIDTRIDNEKGAKQSTFNLAAVDRSEGDMPKSAKFEVVDKGLLGILESLSENVTATLKVEINGKPYEAPITHDDHGHKH